MGTLVSKEYANELLEELKKATEINSAMFNKVRSRLNILKKYEEELEKKKAKKKKNNAVL